MDERDPAPILKRAAEQIAAGATYLDVNIGPAEKDGPERMMWAVKLLQENFDNVPLALDTANKKAMEAVENGPLSEERRQELLKTRRDGLNARRKVRACVRKELCRFQKPQSSESQDTPEPKERRKLPADEEYI